MACHAYIYSIFKLFTTDLVTKVKLREAQTGAEWRAKMRGEEESHASDTKVSITVLHHITCVHLRISIQITNTCIICISIYQFIIGIHLVYLLQYNGDLISQT